MNIPRELTAEEERDLQEWEANELAEWQREQSWLEHEQTMDPAWSINDYENSIAEQSLDDDE
ncbi:MAG: hypothetical protein PHX12_05955 [Proteiniphilum sp.]|nr:hypothetical protein [Proteiniphilum sp.]